MAYNLTVCVYGDTYAVARDGEVIVFGLTQEEAAFYSTGQMPSVPKATRAPPARFEAQPAQTIGKKPAPTRPRKRAGRRLILEPHLDTIKKIMETNPDASIKDIEYVLISKGIIFSSRRCIENLLERFALKISANNIDKCHDEVSVDDFAILRASYNKRNQRRRIRHLSGCP